MRKNTARISTVILAQFFGFSSELWACHNECLSTMTQMLQEIEKLVDERQKLREELQDARIEIARVQADQMKVMTTYQSPDLATCFGPITFRTLGFNAAMRIQNLETARNKFVVEEWFRHEKTVKEEVQRGEEILSAQRAENLLYLQTWRTVLEPRSPLIMHYAQQEERLKKEQIQASHEKAQLHNWLEMEVQSKSRLQENFKKQSQFIKASHDREEKLIEDLKKAEAEISMLMHYKSEVEKAKASQNEESNFVFVEEYYR